MNEKKSKNIGQKIMSIINVLWIASLIFIAAAMILWISVIVEAYRYYDDGFRFVYIIGVVLFSVILAVILYIKKLFYTGFGLMVEKTESMERMLEEMKKKEPLEKTALEEK